jgi:hypothetical protein
MSLSHYSSAPIMKKPYQVLILAALILSHHASGQELIPLKACNNELISRQADSLKNLFAGKGYALLKEASVSMESEFEFPVIVPLTEGSWYQFVFIGEITSRLYEVRMYDWSERMVIFRQNKWGDVDGNIISYPYVAQFSEFHMMKAVQVNKQKKKNLCGYVMLFKKNADSTSGGQPAPRP